MIRRRLPPTQRRPFRKFNNSEREVREQRPIQRDRPPRRTPEEIAEFNDRKLKVMGIHPDITSQDLYVY